MKKLQYLLLLTVVISCKPNQQKEESQITVDHYSIEQFMDNENVFGGSFSPDNSKILFTSNRSGIYNAYTMPFSGGEYTPVTQSDSNSVFGVSYFPNDERKLLSMDNHGDEIFHLFVSDPEDTLKELTPGKGARASFYGWAHDGKSFFYGYNKRDKRYMDVYEMDIENYKSEMIFKNDSGYSFGGISDNKQFLALTKPINTNDSDIFLYDRENKSFTKINDQQSGNQFADFGKDNEGFYYLTDVGGEFSYLMKHDINTGEKEKVYEQNWDVVYAYFSHNGKYRVTLTNEDASNKLEVYDTEAGEMLDFPEYENKNITNVSISRDEDRMAYYVGSSASPSNLYSSDLQSGEHNQLTDVLNEEIDQKHLVDGKVVRYKSFDSLDIPAIYYEPHQASTDEPVPALVWVHGGPGGQSRLSYSSLIQYLVNHGYAILAVNNRGSSGYGKTFFQLDDQKHGEEDLKDCIEGKNWLAEQADIDPSKIGIIGGSYGGFMTMAALTFHPEEFDVGVNIFGVTNWLRTLRNTPTWWESFKKALYKELGDPFSEDSVRLKQISPLFHAENVTKPLMVLQGANDPRVVKAESDEIVEAVRKNDVPVEYVLFEDEGHGFRKKENEIEGYKKILDFLDKYLAEKKAEASPDEETEEVEEDTVSEEKPV